MPNRDDRDFEEAAGAWLSELTRWLNSGFEVVREGMRYDPSKPLTAFWSWYGAPPDPKDYLPTSGPDSTWLTATELGDLIYRMHHMNQVTALPLHAEVSDKLPILLQMAMAAALERSKEEA